MVNKDVYNTDSDPDDCRIAPGMLCIRYLVGISRFAA